MLAEQDARILVERALPKAHITSPISYRGLYVFQAFGPDPEEGNSDPFISVNQETGEVKDFSVITDGDPYELTALFLAKQNREGR